LIGASFVLCGWWSAHFVLLLVASIAFNYLLSRAILATGEQPARQRLIVTGGIVLNLSALVYYKYLFALLGFVASIGWVATDFGGVILPLGIAFFTFTQIGYLVYCQQGLVRERGLANHVLCVTLFPHRIAGPILHHRRIMPRFAGAASYQPRPATSSRQTDLLTVQALRAIAALLVVAYHAVNLWTERLTGSDVPPWANGSAGVDIFFVISGVVMVLSTERLAKRANAGLVFLRHRIKRIVPLYWLVTTAKIAAVLALPQLALRTHLNWHDTLFSYALLPFHDAAGNFAPVLPVGWTLTYEMFFYLLVALALFLRRPILLVAGPVLGAVYLLAALRQPFWPDVADFANPIVLEFLYGAAIALALRHGRRLPAAIAAVSLLCGLALIMTVPIISGLLRPLVWGLPAAMIVAGAVALEPMLAPRIPRWLLTSGDASYAIYLTHGFMVPVVGLVVMRPGVSGGISLAAMIIGSLVVSAVAGWVTYVILERPILALFRRQSARARPASPE
jgi:exopolysaccharide production protein ExoZ